MGPLGEALPSPQPQSPVMQAVIQPTLPAAGNEGLTSSAFRPSMRHRAPCTDEDHDHQDRLDDMQRAFQRTGGVVTGDGLAVMLRSRTEQPMSLLARWIVHRQVISFQAQGTVGAD